MKPYTIEIQDIDNISTYFKIYFNGIIDGDAIETYLRDINSVKQCNMHKTDNLKYYAIVQPSPCWNIEEAKQDIEKELDRYFNQVHA